MALHSGRYRTAMRMTEHDSHGCAQMPRRILDAAQLMRIHHIARHANREDVPDTAAKDHFGDNPRIRAGQNRRKGLLALLCRAQPHRRRDIAIAAPVGQIHLITLAQPRQALFHRCQFCHIHRSF